MKLTSDTDKPWIKNQTDARPMVRELLAVVLKLRSALKALIKRRRQDRCAMTELANDVATLKRQWSEWKQQPRGNAPPAKRKRSSGS